VDRETYYGFADDYVHTDTEISTLRLDHDFGNGIRGNALLRYADYSRESRITEPQVAGSVTADTPLQDITVNRLVFQGESTERMFQSQFHLFADFRTGFIEHALVAGVELAQES